MVDLDRALPCCAIDDSCGIDFVHVLFLPIAASRADWLYGGLVLEFIMAFFGLDLQKEKSFLSWIVGMKRTRRKKLAFGFGFGF